MSDHEMRNIVQAIDTNLAILTHKLKGQDFPSLIAIKHELELLRRGLFPQLSGPAKYVKEVPFRMYMDDETPFALYIKETGTVIQNPRLKEYHVLFEDPFEAKHVILTAAEIFKQFGILIDANEQLD